MSYDLLSEPWEQIPFGFRLPYACIRFLSPNGYVDSYMFNYYSFTPLNEVLF